MAKIDYHKEKIDVNKLLEGSRTIKSIVGEEYQIGNGDNNNQFAHWCKQKDIENFYKIMSGEKKIITERDEKEFEVGYFAMCLLLQKNLS